MKRTIRLIALLLALVLFGGTLAGCAAVRKPFNYLKRTIEKTIERRLGGQFLELIGEALEGGSIEATYGGSDLYETPLESGTLKAYFDSDKQKLHFTGAVSVGGEQYDGRVFLTAEEFAVASDAFLGSNRYGARFSELTVENVKKSFFHNSYGGKDTDNPLRQEWFDDSVGQDMNTLKSNLFGAYTTLDDLGEAADEILEIFLQALADYAPHHRYSEKGVIYLTATIDNVALSHALRATREQIVRDRSICKELRRVAALEDSTQSVLRGETVNERTIWVENFLSSPNTMDDIRARIENELQPFSLTLDVAVGRFSGMIRTATVGLKVEQAERFTFSMDLSDKSVCTFSLTQNGVKRALTYRTVKDAARYYHAEACYAKTDADGNALLAATATLKADRRQDAFTLTLRKGEQERVLNGSFDKQADAFSFAVNEAVQDGTAHKLSFSLCIKEKDRMPEMIEYTPFYEERSTYYLDNVYPRIERKKQSLVDAWGDAPANADGIRSFLLTVLWLEEEI